MGSIHLQPVHCMGGGAVHVPCHRSWVHRGKVCTPFSQPQPPFSSRRERYPGEVGCSTQNLRKPGSRGRICISYKYLHKLKQNWKKKTEQERHIKGTETCLLWRTQSFFKVGLYKLELLPSPGAWSVTHHPSTPHQTHTLFPTPPHLQEKSDSFSIFWFLIIPIKLGTVKLYGWRCRQIRDDSRLTQSLVLSDFVQYLALSEAFGGQLFGVAHPFLQSTQTGRHVIQRLVQLTLDLQ